MFYVVFVNDRPVAVYEDFASAKSYAPWHAEKTTDRILIAESCKVSECRCSKHAGRVTDA